LREEVPTTISKPVLSWFAKEKLKTLANDSALEVGLHAIDSIAVNRLIAFEEEVNLVFVSQLTIRTLLLRRKLPKFMLLIRTTTWLRRYWLRLTLKMLIEM
jgi:hypothetical protein